MEKTRGRKSRATIPLITFAAPPSGLAIRFLSHLCSLHSTVIFIVLTSGKSILFKTKWGGILCGA
jgi:hypothetical protein